MSFLAEPKDDKRLPLQALGYVSEATRDGLYDLVVRKFMETGITQATLAKRLGKSPAQVCRTLGASGNWTIDTVAELLFAIDGSMLRVSSHRPLLAAKTNRGSSLCLADYHERAATPLVRRSYGSATVKNLDAVSMPKFEGVGG
jgi:hypothetical protein